MTHDTLTINHVLSKLIGRNNLSQEEARSIMEQIMTGAMTPAQIGAYLMALRMKGETIEEITGSAQAMRDQATLLSLSTATRTILDTCGTGGDGLSTFNISTSVAFVVASCGVTVAKHGNHGVSSHCGSADLLNAIGVNIEANLQTMRHCLQQAGIGFLYAPHYHRAMRHAIGPRREMGIRTLFNLLGPLTNPAGANHHLIGVFDAAWVEPLAQVLGRLGSHRALVVHGEDGMDEITTAAATRVAELHADGRVTCSTLTPEQFGLTRVAAERLATTSVIDNTTAFYRVMNNTPGPEQDIVLLNAGAALYISGRSDSIAAGIELARQAIASGQAREKLNALRYYSTHPVEQGEAIERP
ncbi:MAG: anthranilate phosphoribosyltransferase [Magnetococcales bacterium]|nr:anthranilate phosphoribosyltransferase [Magnetococcales bacterium]